MHKKFLKSLAIAVITVVAEETIRYIINSGNRTPQNTAKNNINQDFPKLPNKRNKGT